MSGIWNFLKRHRNKFFIATAVVGGASLAVNYALKKLEEWEKQQLKLLLANEKKQQYFASVQQSCLSTCKNLSPKLKHTISKILDADGVMMALKSNPPNKIELWEHLKILTFTKNVTLILSNVLLAVLVHVQLAVIGGFLYRAQISEGSSHHIDSAVQEKYLLACNYLMNEGVEELIAYIQPIVKSVLHNISLTKMLTPFDLQAIFADIEKIIVSDFRQAPKVFTRCMMPSYVGKSDKNDNFDDSWNKAVLDQMNTETLELLETNDVVDIICGSLKIGWDFLLCSVESHFSPFDVNKLPMAKVIPVLNGFFVGDASKEWIERVCLNRNLPAFMGNVYDAFCN